MAFTYDTKTSDTLTKDSPSVAGTFTNDSKTINYLWVSTTFPWAESEPWNISGDGDILTKDIKS